MTGVKSFYREIFLPLLDFQQLHRVSNHMSVCVCVGNHHFDRFVGLELQGRVAMDIGSSTGGFTDCLLQRGAARVHAFDVGTNQLVWKLRSDPRVNARENYNMRYLKAEDVGEQPDLLVADVSFISLTLVLPPAIDLLKPGGQGLVLVKPQFELSREEVGKGGIVREPELHQKACKRIQDFIQSRADCSWLGLVDSCIQGTDGNREFLAWFQKAG